MNSPLRWIRDLQATARNGLHYARDPFDRQRYERIERIAAEMLAAGSTLSQDEILRISASEAGYITPKVDVRGVVFREDRILMVREALDGDRWTLPGGWADVNETPSEAVVREVREESGFETKAERLLALYDRDRQGHRPAHPWHVYKVFMLCSITGGTPRPNLEASEVAFFPREEIPEDLSTGRVIRAQIERFFDLRGTPGPAEFD